MKKILSIILSFSIIFSLSATAFAAGPYSTTIEDLSTIYGIPMSVMSTLPASTISELSSGVHNDSVIVSNDTYLKVIHNETGDSIVQKASYQEYLDSTQMRDVDQNDWMKIQTTIVDNGTDAQVSAAYTWLTRPAFRMKDVIGLSITQGTVIDNSAGGFYTYTTSQGSFNTNFTSGFDYQGHGVVRNVSLATPDYPVQSDFMFLKADIYKESSSEGLNGAYGHQRASIAINPGFNIDRNGVLSCVGINLGMTYDRYKGYTSIAW